MKCPDFEHMISDLTDGELPGENRKILDEHLLICPSCQTYQKNVEAIREELYHLEQPGIEPEYFQSFAERLKTELYRLGRPGGSGVFLDLGWKWTYTAAAAAFVVLMMIFLLTPSQRLLQDEGIVVTTYEDAIRQIYSSIGGDSELEELFNTLLLASISAEVEDPVWSEEVGYPDELDLFKGVTEEEIRMLKNPNKKTEG